MKADIGLGEKEIPAGSQIFLSPKPISGGNGLY